MLVLSRQDVTELLDLDECIEAVARAFASHAAGDLPVAPGVLGAHVSHGGFHVKTAALGTSPSYFAAKINANFPGNLARHGLPTIQGVIALFDCDTGRPLAILDSIEITIQRTAAASAVAARHLARADARFITLFGCGEQGRSHLRALRRVRNIERVYAIDLDRARCTAFAQAMSRELGTEVVPNAEPVSAMQASDICITCTPSRAPIITTDLVRPGMFLAAVGADNPDKQELEPAVLAQSRVVVDLIAQAATMGDLHHAIRAGVMTESDVHAELGDVVSGKKAGRTHHDQVFVFDSTGTALQDVAAAVIVYERARQQGRGSTIELSPNPLTPHE